MRLYNARVLREVEGDAVKCANSSFSGGALSETWGSCDFRKDA